MQIVKRRLLFDAWAAYRKKRKHLREFNYGFDGFHLFLGVSQASKYTWGCTGPTDTGDVAVDFTPTQISKLHAIINCSDDTAWFMVKAAIAKHKADDNA